jgi:anti-sigma B factor antagonist
LQVLLQCLKIEHQLRQFAGKELLMKITTRQVYDIQVVDIEGRLDSTTSGYGYDELVRIAKGDKKHVLINLEKLDFVTSAGLRALLVAAKLLQSSGGQLKLCNANEMVAGVLQTSGFNSLLNLYPTEAEAIKSF